jgi:hypothetical protein
MGFVEQHSGKLEMSFRNNGSPPENINQKGPNHSRRSRLLFSSRGG